LHVLITGGAGYIGSTTAEELLAAGHEVTVLDDLSTGHRGAVPDGAHLQVGSYGDAAAVTALLGRERVDAVLHCAARSLVGESMENPAKYFRENVAGGIALLDAMREAGVRRIVFSSTAATYGLPERTPIVESDPIRPINAYGETKRSVEGAIRWYGHAYGLRSVILRYFNAAGASRRNGEQHSPETHLIPNVLAAVEEDREVVIFGDDYPTPDGTCIRDYIHVTDLAAAHVLALDKLTRGGEVGILNCGYGRGYSVREVVEAVKKVSGVDFQVEEAGRRAGDPPELVAEASLVRERLGWVPEHDNLEEIVRTAWEWEKRLGEKRV
jgi:UDP-glucose 4-epimerase